MTTKSTDPVTLARRSAVSIGADAYATAGRWLADPEPGGGVMALHAIEAARTGLDVLARQAVERARAEGASWAVIGAALGTTKQAAQQRYGREG